MSVKHIIRIGYGLIIIILLMIVFFGVRLSTEAEEFLVEINSNYKTTLQKMNEIGNSILDANNKYDVFTRQEKLNSDLFSQLLISLKNVLQTIKKNKENEFFTEIDNDILQLEMNIEKYLYQIRYESIADKSKKNELSKLLEDVDIIYQRIYDLSFVISSDNQKENTNHTQAIQACLSILEEIQIRLNQYVNRYFISAAKLIEPINKAHDLLSSVRRSIENKHADVADLLKNISDTSRSLKQLRTIYFQFVNEWEIMDPSASYMMDLQESVGRVEERVADNFSLLRRDMTNFYDTEEQLIIRRFREDRYRFFMLGIIALIFTPIAIFFISRQLSKPVELLLNGAQIIAGGNYEHRVELPSQKEFRELAIDFNHMADAVAERSFALQDSEKKYRLLAENSPDMIFRVSIVTGKYDYVSPAAYDIFGYEPEEWYSTPRFIDGVVHPDSKQYIEDTWGEINNGIVHPTCEYQIIHKNGGNRWVDQRNILVKNNEGEPVSIIGVVSDITHRKQLENELRQSDQRFRTLFELSPDPSWIIDNHRFVECNQAAATILGYSSKTELINMHPSRLSPEFQPDGENSFDKAEQMMNSAIEKGMHRFEWLYERKNGSTFFAEVTLSRMMLQGRTVIYCAWRDISDRKQAERELSAYRGRLEEQVATRTKELEELTAYNRMLFETTPVGLALCNMQGSLVDVNPAYLKIIGYSEEEAKQLSYWDITPRDYEEQETQQLKSLEETGHYGPYEKEYMNSDGKRIPVLLNGLLVEQEGKPYIWSSVEDITERKAAEEAKTEAKEKAEAAAKTKSEFLANMSHEIRTPLNAVLGLAQIGMRDSVEPKTGETFQRILDSGSHLLEVINDVLDFSKLEAGKLTIEKHTFQLAKTIEDVVGLVKELAHNKTLQLSIQLDDDLPDWVEGDSLRFRQIILNLLSNAIKFTERGEVSLIVTRQENRIVFKVKDSGIGMTEQQMDNLFVSFHQADSSTTRKFGGTGLGLVISRNLIKLMGGDIKVDSEVGLGTTFTISLPLAEATANRTKTIERKQEGPQLNGIRILAAEDVELNRLILEDMLKHEGATVVLAENGLQALEKFKQHGENAFDVVLMDVQMPVMDGYEATRQLHKLAPALPIIGLTAHALSEERKRSFREGMVDHITKPIQIADIVDSILKHTSPLKHIPRLAQ